ncbi:hypothetical protein [Bradyrhizobium genosp. A]|uniref:hypothetical protein n=1 Tax=Bradyrhizobium genosp. A TaxID=83626 RepID=UPI003CED96D9
MSLEAPEDGSENSPKANPNSSSPLKSKLFFRGALTTIAAVVASLMFKPILASLSAISGVVTVCESQRLNSSNEFLRTACAFIMPAPSVSPADQAPELQADMGRALIGNWVGKWDEIYDAEFYFGKVGTFSWNDGYRISAHYSIRENPSRPMEAEELLCVIETQTELQCDHPKIRIVLVGSKAAIATIKSTYGMTRVAHLNKQS